MFNPFKSMKIEVYKCLNCKEEIYSRAQHDYISCKCKALALDGGNMGVDNIWRPFRIIGSMDNVFTRIIKLKVIEKELYNDWNESLDKYGRIKE